VQRDRHVLGEKTDDFHLAGVVAARHQVVFGPREIERDQPRFGPDQRDRGGGLNEHVVGRIVTVDLGNVAERDAATGLRHRYIASERSPYLVDRGGEVIAFGRDAIGEPTRFQRRELGRIVNRLTDSLAEPLPIVRAPRRHHELDVLNVLGLVALELVGRHVDEMRAGYRSEPVERGEESVVSARHGRAEQEIAHRERIDEAVIELLVRSLPPRPDAIRRGRTALLPTPGSRGRRKDLPARPRR